MIETTRHKRAHKLRYLGTAIAAALAVCAPSSVWSASVAGASQATIVTAGQLVKSQDLRFGLIVPATTGSTVTIVPASATRTQTGSLTLAGTNYGPAEFTALSNPNQTAFLQLVMPTGSLTLNRVGGGATMTVNNWTFSGSGVLALNAQGFYIFRIGASLAVGANQAQGDYTGTFNMTVNFF